LFAYLLVVAAVVDDGVVVGAGDGARSDEHVVDAAPLWQFFAVPAGLSLTTSLLLAPVEALTIWVSPTLTTVVAVAGAPVVASVGVDRLDPGRANGAVVGLVVGDVVGAAAGLATGVVFYGAVFEGHVANGAGVGPVTRDQLVLGACAVVSAWLFRAVGSGVGSGVGRLITSDP
jgi:hypothetical protein